MSTSFGPQGLNYSTTRPPTDTNASGGVDTWAANCSAIGATDGTYLDASFFNEIIANLRYTVRTAGVPLNDADTMLYDAIVAIVTKAIGIGGSGVSTGSILITPAALVSPAMGVAFSQAFAASGGTGPYTWSVASGALPGGLTLASSTGILSGIPTAVQTYNFTLMATDSLSATGTEVLTGSVTGVALSIDHDDFPPCVQTQPVYKACRNTGGVGPWTWAVSHGSLPAGLSLNASTGVISGTCSGSGDYDHTITCTDNVGSTASFRRKGTVVPHTALAIDTTTLPTMTHGTTFSESIVVSGGTAPYHWAITSGALPASLSLNPGTGLIDYLVTAAGAYSFTVTVTDSAGSPATVSQAYSGTVL